MSCPVCSAAGHDHDKLKQMCLGSPFWMGRIVCGFDKLDFGLHKALSDWYTQKLEQGKRRFLILTPRDHLKTTLFGVSNIIWRVAKNPEERILYVMATTDNAEEKLGLVKQIITNPDGIFAHLFPDRLVDPEVCQKWRQEAIQLPRMGKYPDPTVKAVGITSSIVGGHFTWHIFDDLINEKMAQSIVDQEKVIQFVKRSGPLFVDRKRDVRLIIGTYWDGPFYKWLVEDAPFIHLYEKLIVGCFVDSRFTEFMESIGRKVVVPDGSPIWPQEFTLETLHEEQLEMGDYDFSHQMLNIPVSESMRRFNKEDFRFYETERNGWIGIEPIGTRHDFSYPEYFRSMTIDPATGEGVDKSAITVCAFHRRTGKIFVLEAWQGNVLPDGLINKIFYFNEKWKPHVVAPEDGAFQNTFKHFIREEMKRRSVGFFIQPAKHGGKSKDVRIINGLQPFVKSGKINYTHGCQPLVDELCSIRVLQGKIIGPSPNLSDSFAYHVPFWRAESPERSSGDEFIRTISNRGLDNSPSYGLECLT